MPDDRDFLSKPPEIEMLERESLKFTTALLGGDAAIEITPLSKGGSILAGFQIRLRRD